MKCLKASTLISLAAAFGAMAAVSAPAQAAVTGLLLDEFGASQCVNSSGAVSKYSGNGNMYNSSTTATSVVVCPIDETFWDFNGVALVGVEMTYTDKSTAGNISCALVHVSANGATATAGTSAGSTGSTTTGGTLDLLVPGSVSGGNYFVKCTLPKKGGSSALLTSYRIYIDTP